jgi:hypothetical protein
MIELDNKLILDHIDDLLLSLIRDHPDIRQADVQHHSPLSDPSTYQRLVRLVAAGFLKVTHNGQRSVTYVIAPASEELKKEDEVPASPKEGTHNARSSIP